MAESLSICGHLKSKLISWKAPWWDHENKPMFTQPREPETSLLLSEKIPLKPQAGEQDKFSPERFLCSLWEYIFSVHHAHNCHKTRGRNSRQEVRSVGFICVHCNIYIYTTYRYKTHTHIYATTAELKKLELLPQFTLQICVPALPPSFHPASFVP